ncbi:MAG TPA: hypothetical protein VLA49_22285 [Anaerolineales bacterium]|nr:hypothetical protein [Anaerolineales bacterium]
MTAPGQAAPSGFPGQLGSVSIDPLGFSNRGRGVFAGQTDMNSKLQCPTPFTIVDYIPATAVCNPYFIPALVIGRDIWAADPWR